MSRTTPVRIWDLPTRLFHWLLVLGMGFMWFSAENGGLWMDWHVQVGEFMLALVLFRIIWGFVGSDTSRFASFLRSPAAAIQHWRELSGNRQAYHAGHNPLGAWMVVALLLTLLMQATTGLFASDDIMVEGPLYGLVSTAVSDKLTGLHHLLFNLLLLLATLHVAAVVYYKTRKKTNLIKAMVIGKADWPEQQAVPGGLRFVHAGWGLLLFAVCYALVHFGLQFG